MTRHPIKDDFSIRSLIQTDEPVVRASESLRIGIDALRSSTCASIAVVKGRSFLGMFGLPECAAATLPGYAPVLSNLEMLPAGLDRVVLRADMEGMVGDHADRRPIWTEPDTPIANLAFIFARHRVSTVPILEDGNLLGVISKSRFLECLAGWADG